MDERTLFSMVREDWQEGRKGSAVFLALFSWQAPLGVMYMLVALVVWPLVRYLFTC